MKELHISGFFLNIEKNTFKKIDIDTLCPTPVLIILKTRHRKDP
jgi:hypothetical protein